MDKGQIKRYEVYRQDGFRNTQLYKAFCNKQYGEMFTDEELVKMIVDCIYDYNVSVIEIRPCLDWNIPSEYHNEIFKALLDNNEAFDMNTLDHFMKFYHMIGDNVYLFNDFCEKCKIFTFKREFLLSHHFRTIFSFSTALELLMKTHRKTFSNELLKLTDDEFTLFIQDFFWCTHTVHIPIMTFLIQNFPDKFNTYIYVHIISKFDSYTFLRHKHVNFIRMLTTLDHDTYLYVNKDPFLFILLYSQYNESSYCVDEHGNIFHSDHWYEMDDIFMFTENQCSFNDLFQYFIGCIHENHVEQQIVYDEWGHDIHYPNYKKGKGCLSNKQKKSKRSN